MMFITENLIERGSHWRNFLLAAGAGLALVAVACATDDAQPSDAPSAATSAPAPTATTDTAAADEVDSGVASDIEGFKHQNLSISVGDTVTWTNQDNAPHTVSHGLSPDVESSPEFQSGNFSKDGTFSHTFDAAGTFAYFCEVHPSMVGSITVGSGSAPPTISDPGEDPGY